MKHKLAYLFLAVLIVTCVASTSAQTPPEDIITAKLLKRKIEDGVDNYAYDRVQT